MCIRDRVDISRLGISLREGKLLSKGEWLGSWRSRYFHLLETNGEDGVPNRKLVYFLNDDDQHLKPRDELDLVGQDCTVTVRHDELAEKQGVFEFQLKAWSLAEWKWRTLQLRAETNEDREQWVDALMGPPSEPQSPAASSASLSTPQTVAVTVESLVASPSAKPQPRNA